MNQPSPRLRNVLDARAMNEVLAKYQVINNKLRKRFLRKPNVTEAAEQFASLALQCEHEEQWQYAGICWTSMANCHHNLGNVASEINALMKGGRQFLIAEEKNKSIGCLPVGQENLQAAINCFTHSLVSSQAEPGFFPIISAGSTIEVASALGSTPAGSQQLRKSIFIQPTCLAFVNLALYHTKQADYSAALNVITELVDLIKASITVSNIGNYCKLLHKFEVNQLFLLLILQPTPQRVSPALAEVLEKYAWIEESSSAGASMSEDEFLLMQSLVLACQSHNFHALLKLEAELWLYLDTNQKDLLRRLVETLIT